MLSPEALAAALDLMWAPAVKLERPAPLPRSPRRGDVVAYDGRKQGRKEGRVKRVSLVGEDRYRYYVIDGAGLMVPDEDVLEILEAAR